MYKNTFSLKNKKIYHFSFFFLKYKVSENFTITADCYINDGEFYRGFANTTEKGFNCQNWKSTGRMNLTSDSEKVTIYSSSGSKLLL